LVVDLSVSVVFCVGDCVVVGVAVCICLLLCVGTSLLCAFSSILGWSCWDANGAIGITVASLSPILSVLVSCKFFWCFVSLLFFLGPVYYE
jgi:hypothetical protein